MTMESKNASVSEDQPSETELGEDVMEHNTDSEQGRHSSSSKSFFADLGWSQIVGSADRLGMAVFLAVSLGVILFTFMINLPSIWRETSDFRLLRSGEFLLTVAALGVIVAFMSRSANPLFLTFAILLIGALIVPSKDIVRFALIASGSKRNIEDH